MAKADLQADQAAYDRVLAIAGEAERAGDYSRAISHAIRAWPFLEGMMQFERRWEGATFKSIPCVDMVLRLAPPLLNWSALDQLETLLRARRAIDRSTSDDLADRLRGARALLALAHSIWRHVQANPGASYDAVRADVQGGHSDLRNIIDRWVDMGILVRTGPSSDTRLRLATDLGRAMTAKCSACGENVAMAFRDALHPRSCPKCGDLSEFVLGSEPLRA